jgi:hypothetical protein
MMSKVNKAGGMCHCSVYILRCLWLSHLYFLDVYGSNSPSNSVEQISDGRHDVNISVEIYFLLKELVRVVKIGLLAP